MIMTTIRTLRYKNRQRHVVEEKEKKKEKNYQYTLYMARARLLSRSTQVSCPTPPATLIYAKRK